MAAAVVIAAATVLCGWALAAPAAGERVRLGIEVEAGADLAGSNDGTAAGFGPGLMVPVRIRVAEGADLRLSLGVFGLVGHDRVEWTEQTVDWYSDAHPSIYGVGEGTAGIEFGFAPASAVNPWLGVQAGARAVAGWHTFSGGAASLRDGEKATLRDTIQMAPVVGGAVGVRLQSPNAGVRGVAVEVEAGYSVSFLPEVPLGEVPTAFGASRTAFTLDRVRLGFGVSFPLV